MRLIYNLLLLLLLPIALPFVVLTAFFSAKRKGTIFKRLGFQSIVDNRSLAGPDRPVWIHALSVGEVLSAVELACRLKTEFPFRRIVFSATTRTGFAVAQDRLTGIADEIFYSCYDLPFTVGPMVDRVNPAIVVVVESDIWPNFLWTLEKRAIPVVLANGRLSEKSFAGYRRFSWVMGPVLRAFSAICAQTGQDGDRFVALGVPKESISVTGNIKFDQPVPFLSKEQRTGIRSSLGIGPGARILVAGSTHPGEEELVARAVVSVRKRIQDLALVVAPRDPARAGAVSVFFGGPEAGAFTLEEAGRADRSGPVRVVVIDRIGLLQAIYAVADLAFIGGTLLEFRGHNPLEPAACKIPVLFGPHMEDFDEIARLLIDGNGALRVEDAEEFGAAAAELLFDSNRCRRMGDAAFRVFEANRGALDRVTAICRELVAQADRAPTVPVFSGGFLSAILVPLSVLYGGVARLRRALYSSGTIRSRHLSCPVISVGNITVGGTGKTPMTIHLAKLLQRMGRAPMIVSRGYRGSASAEGGVAGDGTRVLMNVRQAGDEPFMMAQALPGVPVVVGKKRYKTATEAMERLASDVVILDDGFQHFQLARNLNIVLMDSACPVGNGRLLPAGPLREPLSCLAHADGFVFTRAEHTHGRNQPDGVIGPYMAGKPVFKACHKPVLHRWIGAGETEPLPGASVGMDVLSGIKVFVFCGLARNQEFLKSVRRLGACVAGHLFFRDHHAYTTEDLSVIAEKAAAIGAGALVTSEKDYVKIVHAGTFDIDLAVLGVEIDLGPDAERFETFVASSLGIVGAVAH